MPLDGKIPTVLEWTNLPPTTEDVACRYAKKGGILEFAQGRFPASLFVDIDTKHNGIENAAALNLPRTPVDRTGSGGYHRYYKYPKGGLRNNAGKLPPGIDIRADGGQVVAPPSIHPGTGKEYTWEIHPDDCPLAELPPDILEKLRVRGENRDRDNGNMPLLPERIKRASLYLSKMPGAVSGEGGHGTTWKAALAIVKGFLLPDDVAFDLLWREFNPRCEPPWSEKNIQHKIEDAAKSNTTPDGYLLGDSKTHPATNRKAQPGLEDPPEAPPDPKIPAEAFHGLAGDIMRMLEPHTEADPVSLLVSTLAEFGCIIGRRPHLIIDDTYHPLLFWPVLVGNSSKSRKGSSGKRIKKIFKLADTTWTRGLNSGQLSSGEGLIWAVRDETYKKNKKGEEIVDDEGVQDKRLFLVQSEFGSMLRMMSREGNSLSGFIRCAWDGENLIQMTKNSKIRATKPHISIMGHVTENELLRNLSETESSNGFGNRFAWFFVKRSKILPFPGSPDPAKINKAADRLREAVNLARRIDEINLSEAAKDVWRAVYPDLSKDRSEAYVMRLSAIHALMNCQHAIEAIHLEAALALWEYSINSVYHIFGNKTGNPIADAMLEGIKRAGEGGMTDTKISAMFKRNQSAARLAQAKAVPKQAGLIESETCETEGRKVTIWKLRVAN